MPLENIRAGLYEWLEDIGAILLDMMGTYYGVRTVIKDRSVEEPLKDGQGVPVIENGRMKTALVTRRVAEVYDFSQFKKLWFNVRVNAGATTYYSEIAMVQTLDNLRRDGTLEIIDYLERIPDKLIPRKAELVQEMKKREKQCSADEKRRTSHDDEENMLIGGPLSEDKAIARLPVGMQVKYQDLPTVAKSALRQIGENGR